MIARPSHHAYARRTKERPAACLGRRRTHDDDAGPHSRPPALLPAPVRRLLLRWAPVLGWMHGSDRVKGPAACACGEQEDPPQSFLALLLRAGGAASAQPSSCGDPIQMRRPLITPHFHSTPHRALMPAPVQQQATIAAGQIGAGSQGRAMMGDLAGARGVVRRGISLRPRSHDDNTRTCRSERLVRRRAQQSACARGVVGVRRIRWIGC